MGLPASRKNDMASGHACFPPNKITDGSSNVMINGLPAARVGDLLEKHACELTPPHDTVITQGSPTVLINGRPAARVTSKCSCPEFIITGSGNVFVS